MAIEVTAFNYPTDPINNINEVYDWLVANASEYFPGGIVKNADVNHRYIRCYPIEGDDRTQMVIPFYNSNGNAAGCLFPKYATTTYQVNPNGGTYTTNAYRKAAKTPYGVALLANSGATWFVTKTETGSVCTYAIGSQSLNTNRPGVAACDLENDRIPVIRGAFNSMSELVTDLRHISGGGATALVPFVFPCGTHSTSLLYTPFTQATFYGDLQTVVIDGQEYIYDGLIALKG